METTASIIAVIQLTGIIVKLCGGYIREVKDARDEVLNLQRAGKFLPVSSRLASDITDCLADLQALETKLDPGKGKSLIRKVGLRALKWPLRKIEVEVDQTIAENNDLRKLEASTNAGFKLFSDRDEIECLQGTRTELLQEIMEWGMAGTGKSIISRTVSSFFFKRGEGDRGNTKKFFPTLASHLVLWNHELRPEITSKSLREQFEKLLLQPLLSLDQLSRQPQTTVIVVDALDECEHDRDTRNIVRLLPLLQNMKSVRLRVFLTSRPELPIHFGFSDIGSNEYLDLALHEIPEKVTERDIQLFLQHRFAQIKRDKRVIQDWPSDEAIQELVRISLPLFISAATVCRYIEISKLEPKLRLAELLKDQRKYLLQEFQDIVGVIILLEAPLYINTLLIFLGMEADRISNRLESFQSVLSIPDDLDQPLFTQGHLQAHRAWSA
ncbi:hypothetical protein P170DRAFT_456819 [Aspergillus steynii IBT 23096]|uniref:Nephrocystin 3-like N-terminal domain-containing protein n=1 Tax=Aspergillus steynii IBT 23096 TaxID=1392250 RepID=A0A2I2G5T9_9EURO|nr:uncharacterized protein P170DRAFT_456819 [Aspergillus steynii IBT 23096]PLB48213.1 hypothetical protein P170DRAFT_456819 [Aspergillus steynii IBT 23096]